MCFYVELAFVIVCWDEKVVRSIFYVYMKWNKVILSRDHSFILNSHQFLKAFFNVLGSVTSFLLVIIWFRTPSWKLALIEIVIAFVCVPTCILHACIYEFNIYFTITERSKLGIFQVEAGRREANVVRRDQDEAFPPPKICATMTAKKVTTPYVASELFVGMHIRSCQGPKSQLHRHKKGRSHRCRRTQSPESNRRRPRNQQ